jgi:hypothetical protein
VPAGGAAVRTSGARSRYAGGWRPRTPLPRTSVSRLVRPPGDALASRRPPSAWAPTHGRSRRLRASASARHRPVPQSAGAARGRAGQDVPVASPGRRRRAIQTLKVADKNLTGVRADVTILLACRVPACGASRTPRPQARRNDHAAKASPSEARRDSGFGPRPGPGRAPGRFAATATSMREANRPFASFGAGQPARGNSAQMALRRDLSILLRLDRGGKRAQLYEASRRSRHLPRRARAGEAAAAHPALFTEVAFRRRRSSPPTASTTRPRDLNGKAVVLSFLV